MLGFRNEVLKITAKLRPTPHALEEDIVDNASDGAFPGIGSHKTDLIGEYFDTAGFQVVVKGFDVEKVPMGDYGVVYRVVMEFALDEDRSDEQVWFVAYPDDIEYLDAYAPTAEGAEAFVKTNFPDVYEAIQTLPDNERDPNIIREALDNFSVTFDLSKADTAMGQDEVLDTVETYITNRIAFDDATYNAVIDGLIYGRNFTHDKVPADYSGTLREILIESVRLAPTPDTKEGQAIVTYRPSLETWYLVPEAQGGRTPIYIPIDSLKGLVANRPDESDYPFNVDTYINNSSNPEHNFSTVPLATSMGTAAIELAMQSAENKSNHHELLRLYLEALRALHRELGHYLTDGELNIYTSLQEAQTALRNAQPVIGRFIESLEQIDVKPVVEVTGEALIVSPVVSECGENEEAGYVEITLRKLSAELGDVATSRKGIVVEIVPQIVPIDDEADDNYRVKILLKMIDMSTEDPSYVLRDRTFELPLLISDFTRYAYVDLSNEAFYSIPEIEHAEQREAAMKQLDALEMTATTRSTVISAMQQLTDALGNVTSEMQEYDSVDTLRDVALLVTDNENVIDASCDAIESILGIGRQLILSGSHYEDGELKSEGIISAYLDGVVAKHPYLKTSELALILSSIDDDSHKYVVPLSTLEGLQF